MPLSDVSNQDLPLASVIIAARNEEENLPALLKDLTKQSYPLDKLEVIIVNDRSTDRTGEVLEKASKKRQLKAYKHFGFWKCIDTLRDKNELEKIYKKGDPPWLED